MQLIEEEKEESLSDRKGKRPKILSKVSEDFNEEDDDSSIFI